MLIKNVTECIKKVGSTMDNHVEEIRGMGKNKYDLNFQYCVSILNDRIIEIFFFEKLRMDTHVSIGL